MTRKKLNFIYGATIALLIILAIVAISQGYYITLFACLLNTMWLFICRARDILTLRLSNNLEESLSRESIARKELQKMRRRAELAEERVELLEQAFSKAEQIIK